MNTKHLGKMLVCCSILLLLCSCAGSLINSSRNGDFQKVKQMVAEGGNLNDRDHYGSTPLMVAAGGGHKDIVTFLLQKGADVNSKDKYGFSAIFCSMNNDHVSSVELLIKHGASLDTRANNGSTPLMYAAYKGASKTVDFLLKKGVDVNERTPSGYSALTYSVMYLSSLSTKFEPSIMIMLIKAGADVSVKDVKGKTILEIARETSIAEQGKKRDNEAQAAQARIIGPGFKNVVSEHFTISMMSTADAIYDQIAISNRIKEIDSILKTNHK